MGGGTRGPRRALALALAGGLAVALAPTPGLANGTAGLVVDQHVDSTPIAPSLGLTLAVDQPAAIPGDPLTYSGQVTNTGSSFVINGRITAAGGETAISTVASYFYEVDTRTCSFVRSRRRCLRRTPAVVLGAPARHARGCPAPDWLLAVLAWRTPAG